MPRTLEERLNAEPAKGWRPEVGDQVIGEIVSISTAPGTEYGPYPLLEIEPKDGSDPVAVHAYHGVLRSEIERLAPSEGDLIGIKYLGERQGATRTYKHYNVQLDRRVPRTTATPAAAPAPAPVASSTPSPASADWANEEPF